MTTRTYYKFGPFQISTSGRDLTRDGKPFHQLTLTARKVLLVLLENAPHTVTKEKFVSESNLSTHLTRIRQMFKDFPNAIENSYGEGFKFMMPVEKVDKFGNLVAEDSAEPLSAKHDPKPQFVQWGPVAGKPAGMMIGADFIGWDSLKAELESKVLPQVNDLPPGDAVLVLQEWNGKVDWLVRIVGGEGVLIGKVYIGPDPLRVYSVDGLVRVQIFQPMIEAPYEIFQRYSDGTYLKIGDTRTDV